MKRKFGFLVFFTIVLIIVATPTAAISFNLPFHLLSLGKVELKRSSWLDYQIVNPTKVLFSNDLLRSSQGETVQIWCSDLNERQIPINQTKRVGDVCSAPVQPEIESDGSNIAPTRGGSNSLVPYIISPRKTKIATTTPVFRWNSVPGASSYAITLRGEQGIIWETEIEETELTYPEETPLQSGQSYSWVVRANTGETSLDEGEGIPGLAFSVLEESEVQIINDLAQQLTQQGLTQEAEVLALAYLYRGEGLNSKAITTLETFLASGNKDTAVYKLLGDLYLKVRLNVMAKANYLEVVNLAVEEGDLETEAQAHAKLGNVYIILKQKPKAIASLEAAKSIYIKLEGENSEKVEALEVKLSELRL